MKFAKDRTQSDASPQTPAAAGTASAALQQSPLLQQQATQLMAIRHSEQQQLQRKQLCSVVSQQMSLDEEEPLQGKFESAAVSQRQADTSINNTGMPDQLKSGIESLSGYAMDDVKVHYNSAKPAQMQAHAYAQGTDIHLAPGQDQHLPHEAWHVVQQKQGRVKATTQLKGEAINDDPGLEHEADVMGDKATQLQGATTNNFKDTGDGHAPNNVHQRVISVTKEGYRFANSSSAYDTLKDTFRNIEEATLKAVLAQLDAKNEKYHDFKNLKYDVERLAGLPQEEQDLSASPALWVKSGELSTLKGYMDGQVELWPQLAEDLVKYCKLKPDEIKDGLLECGKLTLPIDFKISNDSFTQGASDVPKDLQLRTGQFLVDFMKANGQIPYIQSKEWFKTGEYKVVIEINFYPEREFKEDSEFLGVHKDTDSRNLFVNLIFNNATEMPGTEWTMDEAVPDHQRHAELGSNLPKVEVDNIIGAKEKMATLDGTAPGRANWEGGTVGPNSYVSWVDELIWHSTPAMDKRPKYDRDTLLDCLENNLADYELYYHEAMMIVAENSKGHVTDFVDWLKGAIVDQTTWMDNARELATSADERWVDAAAAITKEIEAIDWNTHKVTGRSGRVETTPDLGIPTNGRTVPTTAGGRSRSNSIVDTIYKNQAALLKMKGGNPMADLPKRSFIRTWVTLVKA